MLKKNEKGASLAIVLIVLMLMIAVTPVVVLSMTTEGKQSKQYNDSFQAYYYAKSGIEITVSLIEKYTKEYLVENTADFYLYGSLEKGLKNSLETKKELGENFDYKKAFENGDINEDIFVEVQWDSKEGTGKIISMGIYQGDKKRIMRDFSFNYSGSITADNLFDYSDFIVLDDNEWYKPKGQIRNMEGYKNKPVVWSNEKNGNIIYDDNNSAYGTFTAPIMYFKDKFMYFKDKDGKEYKSSLKIKKNAENLTFEANFIWFEKNLVFEFQNGKIGNLKLMTFKAKQDNDKLLESNLFGEDINEKLDKNVAEKDTKYGLIYIGNDIKVFDVNGSNINGLKEEALLNGFYYFPEGISLYNEIDKLIEVNFKDIDFEKLNIRKDWLNNINNNDKIEFGEYQ